MSPSKNGTSIEPNASGRCIVVNGSAMSVLTPWTIRVSDSVDAHAARWHAKSIHIHA
jgi:hypothetical protein